MSIDGRVQHSTPLFLRPYILILSVATGHCPLSILSVASFIYKLTSPRYLFSLSSYNLAYTVGSILSIFFPLCLILHHCFCFCWRLQGRSSCPFSFSCIHTLSIQGSLYFCHQNPIRHS
ncbi:hypothetical protein C8R42DRAFT_339384 [Lentinula raphanica]|nr:hypothetical protein C8R42DRAFT_339384 [Lentinula raphanica]